MNEAEECSDVDMPFVDDINNDNSVEVNVQTVDTNDVQMPQATTVQNRYENHAGTFTTDIDIFSPEERMKMEERAKRFGLTDKLKNTVPSQEEDLYSSMGISEDNESAKYIRLNVIHMRGTEDMSTKDVFKYFEDYAPASIEWINDVSCNVVWLDKMSAARAMLRLSKKIVGLGNKSQSLNHVKEEKDKSESGNNMASEGCVVDSQEDVPMQEDEDKQAENCIDIKDINSPLPPGIWRKGIDYPKSKGIFLRFATRADKKQQNAEKMSEYYKKYGNPNFGGVKGILTESRKRMYKEISRSKRKVAEDIFENDGNDRGAKNPWGALSKTWGLHDSTEDTFPSRNEPKDRGSSVKERLGIKSQNTDEIEGKDADEDSDSDEDWCKRNKVLRMRMHADDEEEKMHKRRAQLRQQMSLDKSHQSGDLRARLGKQRKQAMFRDAIQVVVTNANAVKTNFSKSQSGSEEEDGEIIDDDEEEGKVKVWKEESEDEGEIVEEEEGNEESDDSAKEIQGPRGSVVKVVQHKPRVASTVWARLKTPIKSEINDSLFKERQPETRDSRDLRNTLKGGDLRSRIGNHTRGRSPLRIEVKNDKYTEEHDNME